MSKQFISKSKYGLIVLIICLMLGQKTWAALMFQSNSKRTSSGRTQSPPTVYVRDRAASLPPDGLTHYFETSPTLINKPPAKKHLSVFEALMQPDYIDEVNKLNNLKRLQEQVRKQFREKKRQHQQQAFQLLQWDDVIPLQDLQNMQRPQFPKLLEDKYLQFVDIFFENLEEDLKYYQQCSQKIPVTSSQEQKSMIKEVTGGYYAFQRKLQLFILNSKSTIRYLEKYLKDPNGAKPYQTSFQLIHSYSILHMTLNQIFYVLDHLGISRKEQLNRREMRKLYQRKYQMIMDQRNKLEEEQKDREPKTYTFKKIHKKYTQQLGEIYKDIEFQKRNVARMGKQQLYIKALIPYYQQSLKNLKEKVQGFLKIVQTSFQQFKKKHLVWYVQIRETERQMFRCFGTFRAPRSVYHNKVIKDRNKLITIEQAVIPNRRKKNEMILQLVDKTLPQQQSKIFLPIHIELAKEFGMMQTMTNEHIKNSRILNDKDLDPLQQYDKKTIFRKNFDKSGAKLLEVSIEIQHLCYFMSICARTLYQYADDVMDYYQPPPPPKATKQKTEETETNNKQSSYRRRIKQPSLPFECPPIFGEFAMMLKQKAYKMYANPSQGIQVQLVDIRCQFLLIMRNVFRLNQRAAIIGSFAYPSFSKYDKFKKGKRKFTYDSNK